METSNPKKSKMAIALWVITGVLAISCGAYTLLLQGKSNLSNERVTQEKPVQSQTIPETQDDSSILDNRDPGDSSSEQQIPPDGTQAPVRGGHNMGVPPDAPPLKDVKQP